MRDTRRLWFGLGAVLLGTFQLLQVVTARLLHFDDPAGAGPLAVALIEGSTAHPANRCDGSGPLELIFGDGFESGDLLSWSASTP